MATLAARLTVLEDRTAHIASLLADQDQQLTRLEVHRGITQDNDAQYVPLPHDPDDAKEQELQPPPKRRPGKGKLTGDMKHMKVPEDVLDHMKKFLIWATKSQLVHPTQLPALLTSLPFEADYFHQEDIVMKALEAMECPVTGVIPHKERQRLTTYDNVFQGSEAVQWLVDHGYAADREEAVLIGVQLMQRQFIVHVRGTHGFEDSTQLYHFSRFRHGLSTALEPLTRIPVEQCTRPRARSAFSLMYHMVEDKVEEWLLEAKTEDIAVCFTAVVGWVRSTSSDKAKMVIERMMKLAAKPPLKLRIYGFAASLGCGAHLPSDPFTQEEEATLSLVTMAPALKGVQKLIRSGVFMAHPFTSQSVKVKVIKEYNSSGRPVSLQPIDDKRNVVSPIIVARAGHNMRKEVALQAIFQAMNGVWRYGNQKWLCDAPYVRTCDATVARPDGGYVEFVPGRTIREVEFAGGWVTVNVKSLVPSCVGGIVASFILGVSDLNFERWILTGHASRDPEMVPLHLNNLLLENGCDRKKRLSVPRGLLRALKQRVKQDTVRHTTLLEDMQRDLVEAFIQIRRHAPAFVHFCSAVFNGMFDAKTVASFLNGEHVFRTQHPESSVRKWFEHMVTSQLASDVFRRTAKHSLIKAFGAPPVGLGAVALA